MPCFSGLVRNGQIIFRCQVTRPQLVFGKTSASVAEAPLLRGLLDTGAQQSMVTQKVIDGSGFPAFGTRKITSASGEAICKQFLTDVHIAVTNPLSSPNKNGVQAVQVISGGIQNIVVGLLPKASYNFDVLLGMDVMQQCYFTVHGGRYSVCF